MAITKQNTIFVYNENDTDSLDIAMQYQNIHDLPIDNLIGINCSSNEVLTDYSTFQSEVENPIISAMSGLEDIWVIVLGYNVPGGFYDSDAIIAATSRLSRINQAYSKKERNPLFDRKVFQRYNEQLDSAATLDSEKALICSRIDGPNKAFVENILFWSKCAFNTNEVNGRFYLDPYSDLIGTEADEYQVLLTEFESGVLPTLNLETCVTSFIDPYIDAIHALLVEDSFYWGWFTDRGSSAFFRSTDTSRIFFYNADYDGAESIRYASPDRWVQLALKNNYVSAAGSMSNPGIDAFLHPDPFFIAIRERATLGEAMLYSTPYLNWTISFFGDPLLIFALPGVYQNELLEDRNPALFADRETLHEAMFEDLARLIAYGIYRTTQKEDIRDLIALSLDIPIEVDALVIANNLATRTDPYDVLVERLLRDFTEYMEVKVLPDVIIEEELETTEMLDIEDYLEYFSINLSELLVEYFEVDNTLLLLPEGFWNIEVAIQEENSEFEEYHFELQVAADENFTTIIHSIDSETDQTNWFFEENEGSFSPLTSDGIGSNFAGRRIKYQSVAIEYLTSSELYYFRIRQKSSLGTYSYREFEDIIWT